jgi:nuclear transport factor 2 (NTF2) superfamily protein
MTDKSAKELSRGSRSLQSERAAPEEPGDEIERLRAELARYREALEEIRDQTFEQTNSQRLIDQLWHFVRWSKATARSALGQPGERDKK